MGILFYKLLRTIRSTLGQFAALALVVMGGMAAYYGVNTALQNLVSSQQAFYQETRFADYYFEVVHAPASVVGRIREVPGVLGAAGRIQKDVKILKDETARDLGRLVGFAAIEDTPVNRLYVTGGRYFDSASSGDTEALIDSQYARAKGLNPGDRLEVVIEGRKVPLRITGTATSPEFMYKTKNALEFPDIDGMAIIMMPGHKLQQVLKMTDEINQALIRISPGASEAVVKDAVEKILSPYGVITSYPRSEQLSHKYVQSQIDSLRLAAKLLPPGFFIITIMVQFVLLRRLIKAQHLQIGVMKALGYENRSIMIMFTVYSLTITTAGSLLGFLVGSGLAGLITNLLGQILGMPVSEGGINGAALLKGLLISTGTGLASGLLASWEVTRIDPAEAFHGELPAVQEKTFVEEWSRLWEATHSSWKMSLRSISRNRVRFAATTLGITGSVLMILIAINFTNSRDFLLLRYFNEENLYDYTVRFDNPVRGESVESWQDWREVRLMEPVLEIPAVLSKPGEKGTASGSKEDIIIGIDPGSRLRRAFDSDYERLFLPPEGILISRPAAERLGLVTGDLVEVETKPGLGPPRRVKLLVRGINSQNIGGTSFVSLEQANRILQARDVINAVMLKSDPASFLSLEDRLVNIPGVASVLSLEKQETNANRLVAAMTYFTVIMIILSLVIGSSIVYNNSIMCFTERQKELASLRVIGWSSEDISRMLFNEIILALILGAAIGLPLGKYLGGFYLRAISNETFVWPVVLYPSTYVIAAVSTTLFTLAGHLLAMRRVRELDLVEVMKDRN